MIQEITYTIAAKRIHITKTHREGLKHRTTMAILVMSEKVCKILLVLALMLGVPQAWGKFVMLIYLCHFT